MIAWSKLNLIRVFVSAKHEPLLVNISCEIIAIHITDQYPEVAQEMANNQDFEDMTN